MFELVEYDILFELVKYILFELVKYEILFDRRGKS